MYFYPINNCLYYQLRYLPFLVNADAAVFFYRIIDISTISAI